MCTEVISYGEVFAGNGDGSLNGARALSVPDDFVPGNNTSVGVVNANGDAHSDVLLEKLLNNNPTFCTGLSDGKGGFTYVVSLPDGLPGNFVEPETFQADFNGGGKQDLILTGSAGEVWIALSNGSGTFAIPVAINMPRLACSVSNRAAGDLNGDGKPDLVLASQELDSTSPETGGILLIDANGDGTFGARCEIASGNFFDSIQVADVNGDGIPDIEAILAGFSVRATTYSGFATLLGTGEGDFNLPYNETCFAQLWPGPDKEFSK